MNDGGGGDDDDGPQKDNVDIFHSIKIISTYLIRPEQSRAGQRAVVKHTLPFFRLLSFRGRIYFNESFYF